jgi:8-oxo-dGTP diphosphatase
MSELFYEAEANFLFPQGCTCACNGNYCDWCEVYYDGECPDCGHLVTLHRDRYGCGHGYDMEGPCGCERLADFYRQGDGDDSIYKRDAPAEKYPIPVVCAVIIDKDKVLLERRATTGVDGLDRMWDVPGGKMERNETPHQALHREIREEHEIQIEIGRQLPLRTSTWVYQGRRRYWLLIPYACSLVGGGPKLNENLQWWPLGCLPKEILEADREMVMDSRTAAEAK